MKLQVQGQSLRFRLDEVEFSQLLAAQAVSNHTDVAGVGFSQTLQLGDVAQVQFDATPGHWRLTLPRPTVTAYGERLPCREGLDFLLPCGHGEPAEALRVSFEVDVRDSIRTRGAGSRRRMPVEAAR